MVSKTSAGTTKKTPAPAKAKKTALKTSTKSKTAKTTVKAKAIDTQVPVKEDINPLEKVMEIKAHNDEKKSAKVAPKPAKAPVETKCCCCCKDGIFSSWARAYKNIFNFKGRTSRYEFWGFSLLNLFFLMFVISGFVAVNFDAMENSVLSNVSIACFLLFVLIEVITYLSLSIRRLHDAGYTAWKGFFGPLIWAIVLAILLSLGSSYIMDTMGVDLLSAEGGIQGALFAYVFLFVIVLLFCLYYGAKIFIVTSFYEEDKANSEYGDVRYADAFYKAKALKYTVLYYVFITCINFITQQINSYLHLLGQY